MLGYDILHSSYETPARPVSHTIGSPTLMQSPGSGVDLIQQIRELIDQFNGEQSIKHLFWELLSYDRVREPLPTTLLPDSAAALVTNLEIFASSESLTIVYAQTDQLPVGSQIEQIAWAIKRHLFDSILILNCHSGWFLIYPDETTSPRVRLQALPGDPDQRLQTARALAALNAADDSGGALTKLQQSEQLDAFFPGILPNLSDVFDDFDRITKHKDPEVRELRPFLRAISVYPLLTPKQQWGLDIWGQGIPTADQQRFHQERLVLHNLRLVVWMAFKVNRMGMTLSDLVQEGTFGLMTAARRFDLDRRNRFTTYAFYWIRQSMYRALHNQCNLIRWPVHVAPKLIQAARTKEFAGLTAGEKPPLFVRNRIDNACFYETDPYESVIREEISRGVRHITGHLRPSEMQVLESRLGFDGEEQTLEVIGDGRDLTRERVRQIEANALRRLRHPVRHRLLRPYYLLSEWRIYNRYDDGVNGRYRSPFRNLVAAREGF